MASTVFPAPSAGGGIKLVQRGVAASAGSITITAVDTTKAFVTFVSQGAAGTVATNSTVGSTSGTNAAISGTSSGTLSGYYGTATNANAYLFGSRAGKSMEFDGSRSLSLGSSSFSQSSSAISGGTTDATTKQMGVYLSDSTTLVATGACRWEVVEFA